MGRPSVATERRAQILDAFRRCLVRDGLEGTSLEAVAKEAGIARSAVRHFVGNRDALLREAVVEFADAYRRDFEARVRTRPPEARIDALLAFLFGASFTRDHDAEDHAIEVLFAVARHDADAREALRALYSDFVRLVTAELRRAFRQAPAARVRETAYAVVCLAEANATLDWLGLGARRTHDARRAATRLVEGLAAEG
ncbi:MAG: TetR/AcrR family transcriptional regulator [Polyangiales bacterium]|jgi:AcrR family transcriptional regulator